MILFSIFTFTVILVIIGYYIGNVLKPFIFLLELIVPLICFCVGTIGVLSFISSFSDWLLEAFGTNSNYFICMLINNPFLLQLISIICVIICPLLFKLTRILWLMDYELDVKHRFI